MILANVFKLLPDDEAELHCTIASNRHKIGQEREVKAPPGRYHVVVDFTCDGCGAHAEASNEVEVTTAQWGFYLTIPPPPPTWKASGWVFCEACTEKPQYQ